MRRYRKPVIDLPAPLTLQVRCRRCGPAPGIPHDGQHELEGRLGDDEIGDEEAEWFPVTYDLDDEN